MQSDMDLDLEFFKLLSYLKSRKEKLILMSGLTGSGKTTILNKIHTEGVLTEILTPGFSVEMLRHPYTSIAAFDVGGENIIPPLYMQHFQNTKGLIFVVDSNDQNRVLEARDELHKLLNEDELRNATVLVLANKNDLSDAMTTAQLTEELGMKSLIAKQRLIYSTCATTGHGLLGGLDVFFKTIDNTVLHMHILICAGEEMQSTVQHVFTQTNWKIVIGVNPELKFTCVSRVDYVEDQVEEAEAASYPVDMIILGYNEVVNQGLATMKEFISQWKRAGFEGCLVGMGKEVEAELMNFVDIFFPYDCITNIEQLLTAAIKNENIKSYTADMDEFDLVMQTMRAGAHDSESCLKENTCLRWIQVVEIGSVGKGLKALNQGVKNFFSSYNWGMFQHAQHV